MGGWDTKGVLTRGYTPHPYLPHYFLCRERSKMLWLLQISHILKTSLLSSRSSSTFSFTKFQRTGSGPGLSLMGWPGTFSWAMVLGREWGFSGKNTVPLSHLCRAVFLGWMFSSLLPCGEGVGWAEAVHLERLPLADLVGSAGPLFGCLRLYPFIFFFGSLCCAHKCKFNIDSFVLQYYFYCSSICLTALFTYLSPLLDWETSENKDQITMVFIFPKAQDSMVGRR